MKTLNLFLILIVLGAGCTKRSTLPLPTPTPTVEPTTEPMPSPTVTPSPTERKGLTFRCTNCDAREAIIISKMQDAANAVIMTKCFETHFTDTNLRSQLVQTNGLSRLGVVEKIRASSLTIPVTMYYSRWSGVYGYTYPDTPTVYLNRYYRTEGDYKSGAWSIKAETSNGVHEATHKMGFDHDFKATARRPYSVPYTSNFAVDNCVDEVIK